MTLHALELHDHYPGDDHDLDSFDAGVETEGLGNRYGFRIAPARKLLHIRIAGFWTRDTIARFTCDLHAAIALLGCAPDEHLICCDVSDSAIQPQDVVAAFQDLILHGPARARKLALFTTRVLSRMQARRIVAVRDRIAVFATEAAAVHWLLHDGDAGT